MEPEYKRNIHVDHTLRCQDPYSKLNGISNYFLVFEILLQTPKSLIHFRKQFVRLSTIYVDFWEWNTVPLTITSALFRSTFSIKHERNNLILVCRLSIRRFVLDCLALTSNTSGSNQSFPSFRYYIANIFNADFDSFTSNEVRLFLNSCLVRFLNDSRASSTTFGIGGM